MNNANITMPTITALKPILTLEIVPETVDSNCYGFQTIHIYAFNIDGQGMALVSHDDEQEFDSYAGEDLQLILFGDAGDGTKWYRPALPIGGCHASPTSTRLNDSV